ncbi:MFS transporter [Sphingobium nicotianae]|uniref:MFS transporter n=1 Tax=Sphingobium nicotianae TaxID=2782607 RepID=A0A9X1DA76_9SPHN|nr:MFS transporter [Sphingobium nicotianae]MBT2186201.1 MFS transporter [Sphingobium nicotianae]
MLEKTSAPRELGDIIDHRPMTVTQIAVAILCAAALFVDGYDIQVMALAVPSLSRDWALPESSFGLALSAVVIGITFGAGVLGPLGDQIGRKTMLVTAMLAIGIATTCTALATTTTEFVLWRLVTGAALGAGLPNGAALTSEYAPVARRSFIVGLMNVASPMGAFSAGFLAPPVLDAFGWRGAFVIGGAGPLLIAVLILFLAPESLKYLLIRRPADKRIGRILRIIAPDVDPASVTVTSPAHRPRSSPLQLLNREFRARTLLLWALLTLNLFTLYVLVSWLPALLQHSGWASGDALRGAVLIQAGGIGGGIVMANFLDRGATRAALAAGFSFQAVCLLAFSLVPGGFGWVALLLLLGAGVSGCQTALNALSAAYYPPSIKATGVSWALLIGGIGSVLGPLAGAWFIDLGLSTVPILAILAIPALICLVSVSLMKRAWQAH